MKKTGNQFIDVLILPGGGFKDNIKDFKCFSKNMNMVYPTTANDNSIENNQKWSQQARTTINIRTKVRALACLEILKNNEVAEVFITGGIIKPGLPSEAMVIYNYIAYKYQTQLIRLVKNNLLDKDLVEAKLQKLLSKFKLEDKAINTIENFANVVNIIDENNKNYRNISIVSNKFHIARIKEMGIKFGLEFECIEAEKVLFERSKHYQWFLEKTCDPENPVYKAMLDGEKRWIKGLKTMPLYFLPQAVGINDNRLEYLYQSEKTEIDKSLAEKGFTWKEFLNLTYEERMKLREIPT